MESVRKGTRGPFQIEISGYAITTLVTMNIRY